MSAEICIERGRIRDPHFTHRWVPFYLNEVGTLLITRNKNPKDDSKDSEELEEGSAKTNCRGVRIAARKALLQLLQPLVEFVLRSGLSTNDLHSILREAAVRSVAAKQLEVAQRINMSGISASTGIPRAEISRILKATAPTPKQFADRRLHSANRILGFWHEDSKFNSPIGKPADLKIYGHGASFDSLVRTYGLGIPTRAVLDELIRTGALEVRASGLLRAKASVAVDRNLTPRAIRSFGETASQLLSTVLQKINHPQTTQVVGSASGSNMLPGQIPTLRTVRASKAKDFLAALDNLIARASTEVGTKRRRSEKDRVGLTIFCYESKKKTERKKQVVKKRRNFRRHS